VNFPEPYPGLVIRYAYLWMREPDEGREEGTKDRPCAIVMAVTNEDNEWQVLVLPVTHSVPPNATDAIEIPAETKKRLGLYFERFWIVITEANEFLWPGPDLRPILGGAASTIAYGPLPPRFFARVRDKFLERDRREKFARVKRTE
jgi:hypothetical protein